MNQRARDLAVALHGHVASLGPTVRSLSVNEFLTWTLIRIGVATDDALRHIAEDLGLMQASTQRRGRTWWRQVESREDGLLVVAVGPYHDVAQPEGKPS